MKTLELLRVVSPAVLLTTSGCATRPHLTVDTWRQRVSDYVAQEGNGDVSSLRNTTLPVSSQRGYAIFSKPLPRESTDVNGLLLAHRPVAGRLRFIYIVGEVDAGVVQDIRLAVLSSDAGRLHWEVTAPDRAALEAYLRHQPSATVEVTSLPRLVFPAPEDRFLIDVQGDRITVTHEDSGARWTLAVQPSAAPASAFPSSAAKAPQQAEARTMCARGKAPMSRADVRRRRGNSPRR